MKATHLFAALLGLFLVSCEKETPATPLIPEESDYVGTLTVIYQDTPFDNENIRNPPPQGFLLQSDR